MDITENGINSAVDDCPTELQEPIPSTKLERRRLIEEILEQKRMRQEAGEFDFI